MWLVTVGGLCQRDPIGSIEKAQELVHNVQRGKASGRERDAMGGRERDRYVEEAVRWVGWNGSGGGVVVASGGDGE